MTQPALVSLPWRRILVAALLGTLATTTAALLDYRRTGANPLNLIQPGLEGPSLRVVRRDFPGSPIPWGTGHDGQQFYAIARQPMHPTAVAGDLDRPRYRLQRIAYPALSWALHPWGGGPGLITAMFVVGVLALVAGGIATGALASTLGASPWLGMAFPLLPGSYVSLRISTGDAMALAATTAALALALRRRTIPGVAAGVVGALTKEVMVLVLVGFALGRRRRDALAVATAALVAAGAWAMILRIVLPGGGTQVVEFTAPLVGLYRSARAWAGGNELWGLTVPVALAAGTAALLLRGRRHLLAVPIALQIGLICVLSPDALGLSLNGTRTATPLLLLGLIALADRSGQPRATPSDHGSARQDH